jgi:hypothetical protein
MVPKSGIIIRQVRKEMLADAHESLVGVSLSAALYRSPAPPVKKILHPQGIPVHGIQYPYRIYIVVETSLIHPFVHEAYSGTPDYRT